jgi:hypothetical protein
MINCTNNQKTEPTNENKHQSSIIKNHVYDLLTQEQLKRNSDDYEQLKYFIAKYIKNSQYRRASSFHAMRGK